MLSAAYTKIFTQAIQIVIASFSWYMKVYTPSSYALFENFVYNNYIIILEKILIVVYVNILSCK